MTLIQLFTNIANAIRTKTGSSETIKAEDFPTEIASITTGVDTTDANAEPINIRKNKTAYVKGQKITGTLPVLTYPVNPSNPSDFNYQFIAASQASEVVRNNTTYVMGAYQIAGNNEPDSWMFEGNRKMKLGIAQSKVATAISLNANKIKKGEKVLGVTGTYEGQQQSGTISIIENGTVDVSQYATANVNVQGSSSTNNAKILPRTGGYFNIAQFIQGIDDNYDVSAVTNIKQLFYSCLALIKAPTMNTSHITNAQNLFNQCESLVTVPNYNFSSLTGNNNYNMFNGCTSLSNESLNNILAACITMTGVTNKTLKYIGLSSEQATTCQSLSNWSDFVTAGWTTGY